MAPPTPSRTTPSSSSGSAIQVVVRLRPMNEKEKAHGTLPVVTAKTQEKTVTVIKGKGSRQIKSSYSFDNVFTAFSTQEEVFDATVKPVISDVMRGFESTVFAYGQTGTGKTHTMEGSLSSPELYGVIPRSAQAIFEYLKQPQFKEHQVTCSYLEIYNEELRDLLDDGRDKSNEKPTKLEIMEGKRGTFCRGLVEKQVGSAEDVLSLMQKAQHQRIVGETKMNKASSRSHCLFTIQVHGKITLLDGDGNMEFNGKLHMVDLAGSECAKSAGNDKGAANEVARERERMNINRSLLTLGRVISSLKERSEKHNSHVRIPYRDSKLTRILQESLGGRCKTVVVATLSPSMTAIEESISTLNYAQSANGIVNKPVSSSLISLGQNVTTNYPIEKLSEDHSSIEHWQEMELRLQYMQAQVEEAQAALARKHLLKQEQQDRADKAEADLLESRQKLFQANSEVSSLKASLEAEKRHREKVEKELKNSRRELRKSELVLRATRATEAALTSEAKSLIQSLEDIVQERNELHAMVASQRDLECERRKTTANFNAAIARVLDNVESSFSTLTSKIDASTSSLMTSIDQSHETGRRSIVDILGVIDDVSKNVACVTDAIKAQLVADGGILPVVETGSNSLLTEVKTMEDMFTRGEDAFEESCDVIRKRLNEYVNILDDRAASIQSATTKNLERFEVKVHDSSNAVKDLINKAKTSLSRIHHSKTAASKTLEMTVGKWRDASQENSKQILHTSSSSCDSLDKTILEFQGDLLHHERLGESLENQRRLLEQDCSNFMGSIDQQAALLQSHQQNLTDGGKTQIEVRNEVLKSIISGVEALVSSEIEKLAKAQRDQFKILEQGSIDLVGKNSDMLRSAKGVFDNIQSTNVTASDEASKIYGNDKRMQEVVKSSRAAFKEVVDSSTDHQKTVNQMANDSLGCMSNMRKLDDENIEIGERIEIDGKGCAESLVPSLLEQTMFDVNKTTQSGLDAFTFVNDVVVNHVNGSLNDVTSTRKFVANQMKEKLSGARTHVTNLRAEIATKASSQVNLAENLADDTAKVVRNFSEVIAPEYVERLDITRTSLASSITDMADSSSTAINEGILKGTEAKNSLQHFARNTLKCTDPVPPPPIMKECKFSTDLTSTPADEKILLGIDFDTAEGESVTHSIVDPCKVESPQDELLQEDENSSSSGKSALSQISHPSPALKSRDLNANHGEFQGGTRPRRNIGMSPASSGRRKNRAFIGLTPSKKRKLKR